MPRSLWTDLGGLAYEQGYVDARGIRTRYLHAGRRGAPPLVLLHGFGGHAEAYQRNLAAHAPDFDVWSLDMLGHGYTDKPDRAYDIPAYLEHLAATLDALQIARAHFSGESIGGATMDLEVLETVREKMLAAVQEPRRHTRARLEWLMADPAAVNDDIVECRARIYEQPGMVEAVRRGMVLYEPETRARHLMTDEKLARIAAPTLVIWTTKDPTAAPAVGERIARAIPRGRYRLMQRCGHWPQWEDPETFNRLHLDFLLGRLD
jgi:2-hydroxy-6-oxonona-2,4-dienedioate hydrolase